MMTKTETGSLKTEAEIKTEAETESSETKRPEARSPETESPETESDRDRDRG